MAKKYADNKVDGIRVAKFDSTANDADHDKIKVEGFPTF